MQNFQGPLTYSQAIFGWVTWTPKKEVSTKSISSWGYGEGGHVIPFRNRFDEANAMLGVEPWGLVESKSCIKQKLGIKGHIIKIPKNISSGKSPRDIWWGDMSLVKFCIFHNKKCTSA